MKTTLTLVSAAIVCASAGASENPWSIRVGVHIPTFSSTASTSAGGTFGIAYRVYQGEGMALEIESVATTFGTNDGSTVSTFGVGQTNLLAIFGTGGKHGDGVYFGVGIGTAQGIGFDTGNVISGDRSTIFTILGGLNLSRTSFIEARLAGGDVPAFRGLDFLFGFRF